MLLIFIWKWLMDKKTWNFSKWPGDGAFLSLKIPTYFRVRKKKKKKSIRTSTSPRTFSLSFCSCCVCVWVLRESEWGEKVRCWFMQIYAHKLLQTIWCCVPAKEHEEHESGRAARVGVCVCAPDICAYHLFMLCIHIWWLLKHMLFQFFFY